MSALRRGRDGVWRATDATLGRQVAIKILPDSFATEPDRLARFEREAKMLASLNHPHIAAIYGFEKSSGMHAHVMELVEGDDLSQRITKGAIPIDEALPIPKVSPVNTYGPDLWPCQPAPDSLPAAGSQAALADG